MACPCGMGMGWWARTPAGASAVKDAPKDDNQGQADAGKEMPAVQVKLIPLTEAESARWKRVRAKFKEERDREISPIKKSLADDAKQKSQPIPKGDVGPGGGLFPGEAEFLKKRIEQLPTLHFQCVGYSLRDKAWAIVHLGLSPDGTKWFDKPALESHLPPFGKLQNDRDARKRAADLAAFPDIRCVAIVDLFSADDPSVSAWVHDSGSGPETTSAFPFPDLHEPFKSFIHQLQAGAK
jgi:hypothetical protein